MLFRSPVQGCILITVGGRVNDVLFKSALITSVQKNVRQSRRAFDTSKETTNQEGINTKMENLSKHCLE